MRRLILNSQLKAPVLFLIILGLSFLMVNVAGAENSFHEIHPTAKNGVLDLTAWDLDTDGIVPLEGQWEFYWQALLEPADFADSNGSPELINVPGTWNQYKVNNEAIGGMGYATYKLSVEIDSQDRLLALKIPRVFTAYTLWINGELAASAGSVGTSRENSTPKYLPQVAVFDAGEGKVEIVMQVSNYHHRSGGVLENIGFGLEEQILDARYRALGLELFIFGCLFIMGLYHLGLYAFRRSELSSLVFGVYCLAIGMRTLLAGEIFFIYLWPGFNWEVAHNLQTLAFYLGLPLFVMFIRLIFPQDVPLRAVRLVQAISLAFSLLVVFTPARIFTHVNPAFQMFFLATIPYFVYTLIRAIRNKRQGALVIGTGAFALILSTVNDVIFLSVIMNDYPAPLLREIVTRGNLSSLGILAFAFAQALVLAMKFSTAFTRVEEMSAEVQELNINMEDKVAERTADLEKSNEELDEAYRELFKLQKFRRNLLANISHDLRSPMTTIKGYVDAILDGMVKDPNEQRRYLEVVREKSLGLEILTRELFELARLESREVNLDLGVFSAEEIVQAIYLKYRLDAEAKGINLSLDIPEQTPIVNVDIEQIARVFDNLIANSIRHSPAGGSITIGYFAQENQVVFSVTDTGEGIQEADLPNIFDRFYKGDKSRTASSGGSGLGLAVAREIVEYHGGKIWARNNPGAGSTFGFSLPVHQ
ncbi:MAG: diguanylate cyclase [Firmicutes bacterium]|nr:diguanylate cyclase [Bacillota bacterium]